MNRFQEISIVWRYPLYVLGVMLFFIFSGSGSAAAAADASLESVKQSIAARFSTVRPRQWGENVTGVHTHLATNDKLLALTLDACGSPRGNRLDITLIKFLEKEQIPATLFINGRWIDANPEAFRMLAANPLFEIANHGARHKPASVNGRTAYGIKGTESVTEFVDEIEQNARLIEHRTGRRPAWYRSGTAYYDEVAVQIANALGQKIAGYSVLGDAGATFSADQVSRALLSSRPGDIILCHVNHPESGTAAGIIAAIPELKRRGFRFVRLSDLPTQ